MAAAAMPPPSAGAVQPSAAPPQSVQNIGGQGQAQGSDPGQMANQNMQAVQQTVKELSLKTVEAWNMVKASYPALGAYFAKMAEIGSAIEQEVGKLAQQQQQGGAQQPSAGNQAPSPTDGPSA